MWYSTLRVHIGMHTASKEFSHASTRAENKQRACEVRHARHVKVEVPRLCEHSEYGDSTSDGRDESGHCRRKPAKQRGESVHCPDAAERHVQQRLQSHHREDDGGSARFLRTSIVYTCTVQYIPELLYCSL